VLFVNAPVAAVESKASCANTGIEIESAANVESATLLVSFI
jgi:hypothetical protein